MVNILKKAILVVSFGTSYEDTRVKCIESIENKIKNKFNGFEVRRAFTSNMIIKKLKERDNLYIDTTSEALKRLKEDGYREIYVQSLHLIPGDEYDKVRDSVLKFEGEFDVLKLGRPLLYNSEDYIIAVEALKNQLPSRTENHAVLLMGHGSGHYSNSAYPCLQYVLEDLGETNVYMATVEGYPNFDNVKEKLKQKNIQEITLMPYMLVAGDHARNDMAGEEEESWEQILKVLDMKVNVYMHGLGENEKYQDIFVQHLADIVRED